MITEDYVSFETAKLLKEKGFNEICEMFYCKPHEGYLKNRKRDEWWNSDLREDMTCTCPSIQMAMKWLREVHKLHISVVMGFDVDNSQYFFYVPSVCRFSNKSGEYQTPFGEKEFGSYEEACEAVIKYCLENLI